MIKFIKEWVFRKYVPKKHHYKIVSMYAETCREEYMQLVEFNRELLHTLLHAETIFYSKNAEKKRLYDRNLSLVRVKLY